MDRKTIKTILIVIGSGIGGILLFITVVISFAYYKFYKPLLSSDFTSLSQETVTVLPEIAEKERFLGSSAVYSGEFSDNRSKVLTEGRGKIIGQVTSNGKPVKGLRLRLALNGSVMSQWGVTNSDGEYTINVPFGKYRIDGYKFDHSSADLILAGKIGNPRNAHASEIMLVNEKKIGRGLDLDYVDPVIKSGPIGEVSLSEPIIVTWEPYPGASTYRIQLMEQKNPRDYMEQKYLFNWSKRPTVQEAFINITEQGIKLKKSHYYTVEINALDDKQRKISESASRHGRPDFLVTE
ncbi:MAG: carboxypeptidase regulatory-like domain-containing protein [Candidatus Omnitrophica bacterium]|nr:carboxypeptidase regulatory-like domain-containing protein [Candidatus Omnitrophota bacterium]